MRADAVEEFTAYVAACAPRMRRAAYLVCGDWQRAEDEVQTALVKLYLAWDRVRARSSLGGFVRTTLVRGLIDERRRPWKREQSRAVMPDRAAVEPLAVYVNPKTYLPVRLSGSAYQYGGPAPTLLFTSVTDMQWLRPAAASIAKTLVTIPAGFRQVSSPADQ
jgi:DNA-directed RNA polymerase specialized sigma24 family protein